MTNRISVHDKLPEHAWENKLVWDAADGFDIASCNKDTDGTWTNLYGDRLYKVEYWWDLPEDPGEDEE